MLLVFPFIAPGLIIQFPAGKPFNTAPPVATVHEGCVIVPTVGAAGVAGCVLITTPADAGDTHPTALVTVKVGIPVARPGIVRFVPVPAITPGLTVQFPAGKPPKITLPVETAQVGCVIKPTVGACGVAGCTSITTLAEAGEIHPDIVVTVNVKVPVARPDIVLLAVFPAIAPGLIVQFPAGKPLKTTLPVATVQVGCVIAPTIGVVGVAG